MSWERKNMGEWHWQSYVFPSADARYPGITAHWQQCNGPHGVRIKGDVGTNSFYVFGRDGRWWVSRWGTRGEDSVLTAKVRSLSAAKAMYLLMVG